MNSRAQWILIIISVLIIIGLYRSVYDLWSKRSIYEDRQVVAKRLQEENDQLKKRLSEVKTPFFVEKEAREKLGMVKENETIVLMDTNKKGEDRGEKEEKKRLPNWEQWKDLFF